MSAWLWAIPTLVWVFVPFFAYKSGYHRAMSICCADVSRALHAIDASGKGYEAVPEALDALARKWSP